MLSSAADVASEAGDAWRIPAHHPPLADRPETVLDAGIWHVCGYREAQCVLADTATILLG